MIPSTRHFSTLLFSALLLAPLIPARAAAEPGLTYNRDIRPILSENCFNCHGPDSASRKAGLRLDSFAAATTPNEDGVSSLIPGKADASELVKRVFTSDEDDVMPPPESHKALNADQKEILKRWINEGAEYEPHWSFMAPVRPAPPAVSNPSWLRNPVDSFVLARLDSAGLAPAPEADRRTLARRVSLDLTGLPPEPSMVEAFVTDPDPAAYEALVDRLLASPAWGEHRARYWMDYARYADTHGIHFDNYREMWPYRQNVIEAFNRNQPYDQFTIEQLAGDLLPDRTIDQQIASGFNRCNITTNEGGAIAEEYNVLYARDRTEATSQVWLGLTTGCAVCHDHKFDPVSQKEFYALSAFFNNTTMAAMDGNIKGTPPVVVVSTPEDRPRWNALPAELAAARQTADDRKAAARPEFDAWALSSGPEVFAFPDHLKRPALHLPLDETAGTSLTRQNPVSTSSLSAAAGVGAVDGPLGGKAYQVTEGTTVEVPDAGDFEWNTPFAFSSWVRLPGGNPTGSAFARMDEDQQHRGWDCFIQGGRPATHIIHAWPDHALKVTTKNPLPANQWQHVAISYDGSGKAAGVTIFVNGEAQPLNVELDQLSDTIRNETPLKLGQRKKGDRLNGLGLADLRLHSQALSAEDANLLANSGRFAATLAKQPGERSPEELETLLGWYLIHRNPPWQEASRAIAALENEQAEIRQRASVSLVMQEKDSEAEAYLLTRGAYDQRDGRLTPGTPAALPPMSDDLPRNRLGFAQWLLRPENPLTARVTVNRFWQEVFGTGLVRTAGDFGISGELPSHPALLDWLAVEFRESGWDMKHLFRLLVTSATYRQSAGITPEKLSKDPANTLLSRGPRFRMDAEMVRDYALSTSGLLVDKIGGPSVRPYQPDGIWDAVAMPESDTRNYVADTGEGLYRRSLYTFWKRAAPPASMDNFNAPARENCTVRRERTNTPLQALNTLNDIQFVEAARTLAVHTLRDAGPAPIARLNHMGERVLSRSFTLDEQVILIASLINLTREFEARPEDAQSLITFGQSKPASPAPAPELAAWTMIASEILNLDETLNK